MDYFVIRRGERATMRATARFSAVSLGELTLFAEGPIFRLDRSAPHVGAHPGSALLERFRDRGPSCLADVVGDFVACIVTPSHTYAWKSFTSQYQLYLNGRTLSNRLFAVVHDELPPLDADFFARHVMLVPGVQFHLPRTPLRDVSRILPGELVTLGDTITKQQLVSRTYSYRLDSHQKREDVAPEIVRLLRESVRDHLAAPREGGVVVELSGGLDSSFVACLVGEATSGAKAVMFSRPDVPSHRESEGYAQAVAKRYGLDLSILAPEDLPAAPRLLDPAYGDEPSDFFWFGDLFSRAIANRAGEGSLVFTGFGADQLFLRSPSFLPYLLSHRKLGTFAKNLGAVAKLISRSPSQLVLQSVLSQLPRGLYFELARPFSKMRWNPLDVGDVNLNRTLYEPVAWLKESLSQELFDAERKLAEAHLFGSGILCDDWGYFSAPRTVVSPHFDPKRLVDASPYCDLRLIDFVYDQVSALLVHDFEGRYKELLREAQKGVVPEDLRARKNDMFVFNSFLGDYVRKGQEELRALIEEAPSEWVDRRGASLAFEELAFGKMTSSTRSLIALFGYLLWWRAFQREVRRLRAGEP